MGQLEGETPSFASSRRARAVRPGRLPEPREGRREGGTDRRGAPASSARGLGASSPAGAARREWGCVADLNFSYLMILPRT